jgi:hypothetical protein
MRKSWVYIERRFWWIPGPKIKDSMVFNDAARLFYYGVVTESRHSKADFLNSRAWLPSGNLHLRTLPGRSSWTKSGVVRHLRL